MQITIDDDTFHRWALDRGYVRLTDISDFANRKFTSVIVNEVDPPDPANPPVAYGKPARDDRWLQQKQMRQNSPGSEADTYTGRRTEAYTEAAMGDWPAENLDDLKPADPVPTLKEATDALRAVVAEKNSDVGLKLLADFGAARIGDVPEARRREFIAAAEKVRA